MTTKVIRVHPIRHDRAKELGAFANPKGRPRRKNSATSNVAQVPELDTVDGLVVDGLGEDVADACRVLAEDVRVDAQGHRRIDVTETRGDYVRGPQ